MTMACRPYGNLIFQHRRESNQSGSMHEAEETSGLGTTAYKATVDKDRANKVESESLLPTERIRKLEEGLESLTSVVDKGFNRQEHWITWIVSFGVGTVIKDSKNELEDKFGQTLQLSLAALKSDILLAIAKEELKATKKD
ncbi:hypothetical protein L873DRAFT_1808657, partial [Choiromyces venosus 120613-1]